jgi:hypothetical protein
VTVLPGQRRPHHLFANRRAVVPSGASTTS